MSGAVKGQGYGFEAAEVLGHLFGVVVGAAAVGAGDEDHEGLAGLGHVVVLSAYSCPILHEFENNFDNIVQFRAMSSMVVHEGLC